MKKQKLKRISEISKELGITRQALDKRIRTTELKSLLKVQGGIVLIGSVRYITPNGQRLIKKLYNQETNIKYDERIDNLYHFNMKLLHENYRLKKEISELRINLLLSQSINPK